MGPELDNGQEMTREYGLLGRSAKKRLNLRLANKINRLERGKEHIGQREDWKMYCGQIKVFRFES